MVTNPAPFEVIAAPFVVYHSPVGTAFPAVDTAPPAPWVLLGTNGADSYFEDGVTVAQEETVELFRGLASTAPLKAFRTEESLIVRLRLADISLEQYKLALNNNAVGITAAGSGTPGFRTLGLSRGPQVIQVALLVRGEVSPYGQSGLNSQWELPRVSLNGNPEIIFQKGVPIGLDLEFQAMADLAASDDTEKFGRVIIQDAVALP